MIKEELTKLLMEAYERGQSDIIKSCHETVAIAVDTAILAEREACAKVCEDQADDGTEGEWDGCCLSLANKIRARGRA